MNPTATKKLICLIMILLWPLSLAAELFQPPNPSSIAPQYSYRITKQYPHDPESFTQGLVYVDGKLYESIGLRHKSALLRVNLASGAIEQRLHLADKYFAEGLTWFNGQLLQLTYSSRLGFVYDSHSFKLLSTFKYPTQGWGLTHNGQQLIMSDGSDKLYFLDADNFKTVKTLHVYDQKGPLKQINELEYIDGYIFANIWKSAEIVIISPSTGKVVSTIDLTGLGPNSKDGDDVLNGIAWDPEQKRLWVTGKRWPLLYQIELIAKTKRPNP